MNNSDRLDKLFQAARDAKPDTSRVEYGFEARLMARIRSEEEPESPWFVWAWKLMPAFAAIVLALGVWNFTGPSVSPNDLHAAITGGVEESQLVSFLTGE